MFEAEDTFALIDALEEGARAPRWESLLERRDLRRMFPAVGIPRAQGIRYLEAAGNPDGGKGLDEVGRMVVGYLVELLQRRGRIASLLRELEVAGPSLEAAAFARARELLPDSCAVGAVRYVLLPIGYDFRTDRETVYMDPLAALEYGRAGIETTLSHELHHVARYRLTGENLTLMRPGEERPARDVPGIFREWASWLEAEGIADGVSNATDVEIPALRAAIELRREQMANYAGLLEGALARLRRTLSDEMKDEGPRQSLRQFLLALAHPVGARMAEHVRADLGRESVIECVGRPDLFVERYNRVARRRELVEVDESFLRWTAGPVVAEARAPR